MGRLLTVQIILLTISFVTWAAPAPDLVNYQGVLRDTDGNPLEGSFEMVLRLYDAETDGTLLLTDAHTGAGAATVTGGLFNVRLGGGAITPGAYAGLSAAVADESEVWLEVEVGGETLAPRTRLISSPYALNAKSLEGFDSTYYNDRFVVAETAIVSLDSRLAELEDSVGQLTNCGNGTVDSGEECDDGNTSDTDACLTTCVWADCGDGFVQEGVEECDDGNASNHDACLNSCVLALCGDGFLYVGVEECDDGNYVNGDACLDDCTDATCGDGYVYAGVEECDDGNESNEDSCLADCTSAACGDGFVNFGVEECDDGNYVNGDFCDAGCLRECLLGDNQAQFENSCYMMFLEEQTWSDARSTCELFGAHLVSIFSISENQHVATLLGGSTQAWIGLSDSQIEGTFLWFVGPGQALVPTYDNWESGEPDDAGGADCVVIDSDTGAWSDQVCTYSFGFVCEYDY